MQPKQSSGEPGCTKPPQVGRSSARFVEDVTVPDGTPVVAGTRLTKMWKIRNAGMVGWPDGSMLVQIGGDAMGGQPVQVASVSPGAEGVIAVELVAPSRPGRYVSYWRLAEPTGRKFGQRIWCGFTVVDQDSSN